MPEQRTFATELFTIHTEWQEMAPLNDSDVKTPTKRFAYVLHSVTGPAFIDNRTNKVLYMINGDLFDRSVWYEHSNIDEKTLTYLSLRYKTLFCIPTSVDTAKEYMHIHAQITNMPCEDVYITLAFAQAHAQTVLFDIRGDLVVRMNYPFVSYVTVKQ